MSELVCERLCVVLCVCVCMVVFCQRLGWIICMSAGEREGVCVIV